jgi:hypothetical protein
MEETLGELYLNYDTANVLKSDISYNEIIEMFKNELSYPENLTKSLLEFNKSYIDSVIMRLKIRKKTLETNELKKDILKFNPKLEPIIDKILINEDNHKISKIELDECDDNNNNDVNPNIEIILTNYINSNIDVCDSKESIKVNTLYDNFINYCETNNETKIEKSEFKEFFNNKFGKSTNNSYKGIKLK